MLWPFVSRARDTALAAFLFICLVACAGCTTGVYRVYPGEKRDPSQVARVHQTKEISLDGIDGKTMAQLRPWYFYVPFIGYHKAVYAELPPGEHEIKVIYFRVQGNTVARGSHALTFRYPFEAGRDYSFLVRTTEGPPDPNNHNLNATGTGYWMPLLIDRDSQQVLAEPQKVTTAP
jgi:hypothetical protein